MNVMLKRVFALILIVLTAGSAHAQRDLIKLKNLDTSISAAQASELTLTLNPASLRSIQQIVRTAGSIDKSRKTLTAFVGSPDGDLVKEGQRVRAFALQAKSSMFQARVSRVNRTPGGATVEAMFSSQGFENTSNYVMEITVDRGEYLSIPNEAIIEEGTRRIVYVQKEVGKYAPVVIQTGLQGELLTEIVKGLNAGDQVVTFGSFFIDSEYKLKIAGPETTK